VEKPDRKLLHGKARRAAIALSFFGPLGRQPRKHGAPLKGNSDYARSKEHRVVRDFYTRPDNRPPTLDRSEFAKVRMENHGRTCLHLTNGEYQIKVSGGLPRMAASVCLQGYPRFGSSTESLILLLLTVMAGKVGFAFPSASIAGFGIN